MNMDYTRSDLMQGNINKNKAQETQNSFAMQDGVSTPQPTTPLDRSAKSRMAGQMGSRALALMQDPVEQRRVGDWMNRFRMSNQGMEWNQAKMMGGMPPPPGA